MNPLSKEMTTFLQETIIHTAVGFVVGAVAGRAPQEQT